MVATRPHVPEGAISLTLSGGGRRERHRELFVLGHSPQTVGVHLDIEVLLRRCPRGSSRNRLSLDPGHSSGRRTADEIRFSRSELKIREVRHPNVRYHDSRSMIHRQFQSKRPLFPVFPTFLTRRKRGVSFIYGQASLRMPRKISFL